jgi:hypothetical protein
LLTNTFFSGELTIIINRTRFRKKIIKKNYKSWTHRGRWLGDMVIDSVFLQHLTNCQFIGLRPFIALFQKQYWPISMIFYLPLVRTAYHCNYRAIADWNCSSWKAEDCYPWIEWLSYYFIIWLYYIISESHDNRPNRSIKP